MANITAKTSSNVFYRARCEASAHMGIKIMTVEEFEEKLMHIGCYLTDDIKELVSFLRKRYPGLTSEEIDELIKNNVFCCRLYEEGGN